MKEIIFKYLKSLNINGLSVFKNGPAIFLDQAPDDSDSRWNGSQYGRIIYGLNLKDDSERKVSGTMEIAIAYLFNNQGYKNLLEAKKILKKAFEGVISGSNRRANGCRSMWISVDIRCICFSKTFIPSAGCSRFFGKTH